MIIFLKALIVSLFFCIGVILTLCALIVLYGADESGVVIFSTWRITKV